MKLFVLLVLLAMSLPAFSQTCYVDMVDRYNRVVRSFTGFGDPNSCLEGMKQCRKAIRFEPQLGGVDCLRANSQQPTPQPNPYPNPQPNPYPMPNQIMIGETVFNISNSRYAVVVAQDYSAKYVLRYNDNNATGTGWDRSDLALLRGCERDLCVNDQIFNVSNSRYAAVAGIQLGGKFVLKYSDNGATGSGWAREDVAIMKGCQQGLCVGTRVINVSNRRYAVIRALQSGNRFVLGYEDNGATGSGWSITDLAPIR